MKSMVERKRWGKKKKLPSSFEWTFYLAYLACQRRILQHTNDLFIRWWNKHWSPITHNSGGSSDNMAVVIIAFIEKRKTWPWCILRQGLPLIRLTETDLWTVFEFKGTLRILSFDHLRIIGCCLFCFVVDCLQIMTGSVSHILLNCKPGLGFRMKENNA